MARQPEIRYINTAVCGSCAYQLEDKPRRKSQVRLPKAKRQQKKVVAVDPVAWVSIAVACVLFVLLVVGFVRLQDARAETVALSNYVSTLQEQNSTLRDTYEAGYDLEEIEKIALAMGKVPAAQVSQISVQVQIPVEPDAPTAWESFCAFLTGLFA